MKKLRIIFVVFLLLAKTSFMFAQTPEWLIGDWYSDGVLIFDVHQTKLKDGRNSQVLYWKGDVNNFAYFDGLSSNIAYFRFYNTNDRVSIAKITSNQLIYSNPRTGAEYVLFSSKEASLSQNSQSPVPSWAQGRWHLVGDVTQTIQITSTQFSASWSTQMRYTVTRIDGDRIWFGNSVIIDKTNSSNRISFVLFIDGEWKYFTFEK